MRIIKIDYRVLYTASTALAIIAVLAISIFLFFGISEAEAHRSGCHRWNSCPSDTGSYTCGAKGYPCRYPTYPKSGGVIYPPSGYYKDCYTCPTKKVPSYGSKTLFQYLRKGDSNENVKTLQMALVNDGVYKNAIVSGYYGTLTEEAVKRFQKKHGIVSYGSPRTTGYGRLGPKTLAKINELIKNKSLSAEVKTSIVSPSKPSVPSVPANAYASGSNWYCRDGYKTIYDSSLNKSGCKKVTAPANAYISGSNWYCRDGYKTIYNNSLEKTSCKQVVAPANAYISGSNWYCKNGYKTTYDGNFNKNGCKQVIAPANAYVSGSNWYCRSGYKTTYDNNFKKNGCQQVVAPANAYVSGSNWYCNSGYKTTYDGNFNKNGCKQVIAPANAYVSGSNWYCRSGYKTTYDGNFNKNGCQLK